MAHANAWMICGETGRSAYSLANAVTNLGLSRDGAEDCGIDSELHSNLIGWQSQVMQLVD